MRHICFIPTVNTAKPNRNASDSGTNFDKYSYFQSRMAYGITPFGRIYPDREEVVQASERLLGVLLPVLERDHWPDWEAANRND